MGRGWTVCWREYWFSDNAFGEGGAEVIDIMGNMQSEFMSEDSDKIVVYFEGFWMNVKNCFSLFFFLRGGGGGG
jgi:hypothetical protein